MYRISLFNRVFILFYLGLMLFIIWKVPHEKENVFLKSTHAENKVNEKGDSF